MKTASAYTNARRVTAIGKNSKVEYPKLVAKNWGALQPAVRCTPNFQVIIYKDICKCTGVINNIFVEQPPVLGGILDGDDSTPPAPQFILEGLNAPEPSPEYILEGGSS